MMKAHNVQAMKALRAWLMMSLLQDSPWYLLGLGCACVCRAPLTRSYDRNQYLSSQDAKWCEIVDLLRAGLGSLTAHVLMSWGLWEL